MPEVFLPDSLLPFLAGSLIVLVHLAVAGQVLAAERRQPAATLAWLLSVLLLPGVGVLAYLAVGSTRARKVRRRSALGARRLRELVERFGIDVQRAAVSLESQEVRTVAFLRLAGRLCATPASRGNAVTVLWNGARAYRAMLEAIAAAEHSIHVEFYIIRTDETGQSLCRRLAAKAREGVAVRVLYDDFGSFSQSLEFWQELLEAGGEVQPFNPLRRFSLRWSLRHRVDFRNHRKLVVVDGRVAFTGGINVGREYLGLDPEIGKWRDTHLRVEGPAALACQEIFARDWLSVTGCAADDPSWFPDPETPGEAIVQVIDTGPDSGWSPMSQLYVQLLSSAVERAWITTPYFVPSPAIEEALVSAALRGVDVRLLLPSRCDSVVVGLASRTYYETLLRAGVRIFEYQNGFVHAKTVVVDHWVAGVGSSNVDMRSFLLNFELGVAVLGPETTGEMAAQFERDLEQAEEVDHASLATWSRGRRLACQVARLLSPLL